VDVPAPRFKGEENHEAPTSTSEVPKVAEVPSWFQDDPASLLYQSWAEVEGNVPEAVHKKPVEPVTEAVVLEEVVRVH
jgi:hypothetical protein